MNYFLVFLSLTQTQCAADALRRAGISVSIVRPPLSAGRGSCSYALSVPQSRIAQCMAALSRSGMRPIIYQAAADGSFREVSL